MFFGNAANVGLRRSVLNGERVDMPEKHCSGLVAAFSAVCNGYRYTPKAIFSVDATVNALPYVGPIRVFRKIVKSLANDHPSYTTTPM